MHVHMHNSSEKLEGSRRILCREQLYIHNLYSFVLITGLRNGIALTCLEVSMPIKTDQVFIFYFYFLFVCVCVCMNCRE